ncbi:MAG: hypothetical protein A7315_11530 [Candidatus Altiarchaeales archaeon WOR_SM1_79]|nr:MAG: hypothetical protein A7315_11530 [Candidatus Altiarchaeales archaeon WOR_SM1_79]
MKTKTKKLKRIVTVLILIVAVFLSGCIEEKEQPIDENKTLDEEPPVMGGDKRINEAENKSIEGDKGIEVDKEHCEEAENYINIFENAMNTEDEWAAELWSRIKNKTSKFDAEDINSNPDVQREVAKMVFDEVSRDIEYKEDVFNLSDILKTKSVDCLGYSEVYWIICKKLGLDVGIVRVFKDKNGTYLRDNKAHFCNILKLQDGNEILVDLTYKEFDINHRIVKNKVVNKSSIYSMVLVSKGVLLEEDLKKYEEAEEMYRKAINISPNYVKAYNHLGTLLDRLKRYEEEEEVYRKAIEIDPNYAITYNNLGLLLKDLNRSEEAEKTYWKAIEIDPELPEVHTNFGNLLDDLNRSEEAEEEHRKAIEIDPGFAIAHINLGTLFVYSNRFEEAEEEYKKAIEIGTDYMEAHLFLGIVLVELKKYEEAEGQFKEAIKIEPNCTEAYFTLGGLLMELNRYEEAEKMYRESIKINYSDARAHTNLGGLLSDLYRYDEAEKEYREAIRIDPNLPEPHLGLGILFASTGKNEWAKREFEIAVKLLKEQGREEDAKDVEKVLKQL